MAKCPHAGQSQARRHGLLGPDGTELLFGVIGEGTYDRAQYINEPRHEEIAVRR